MDHMNEMAKANMKDILEPTREKEIGSILEKAHKRIKELEGGTEDRTNTGYHPMSTPMGTKPLLHKTNQKKAKELAKAAQAKSSSFDNEIAKIKKQAYLDCMEKFKDAPDKVKAKAVIVMTELVYPEVKNRYNTENNLDKERKVPQVKEPNFENVSKSETSKVHLDHKQEMFSYTLNKEKAGNEQVHVKEDIEKSFQKKFSMESYSEQKKENSYEKEEVSKTEEYHNVMAYKKFDVKVNYPEQNAPSEQTLELAKQIKENSKEITHEYEP